MCECYAGTPDTNNHSFSITFGNKKPFNLIVLNQMLQGTYARE